VSICYVKGDATKPGGDGNRIIIHCCNDLGYWNAGFVKALSKRWSQPERAYRLWARGQDQALPFALGNVQFVPVATDLFVANIIGQSGIAKDRFAYPPPIRYDAIRKALQTVREFALEHNASIHMPRMGAGLGGGNWQLIAEIIQAELCNKGVCVTVYDLALRIQS
jgi:O-acetyl-ADP-ribose deacetylase (regulator of RNase III)